MKPTCEMLSRLSPNRSRRIRNLKRFASARNGFTVVFYGSGIFSCKTVQFSETPRKLVCLGLALKNRLRNTAKNGAKTGQAITNQLLYQLSYAGEKAAHFNARFQLKQVADPMHGSLKSWHSEFYSRQTGSNFIFSKKTLAETYSQAIHPMNKTAQIINSILALAMLACLTSNVMAGRSINQAKVNQITPGLTTEEDLVRVFGPPSTRTVCPPGETTLDWFYVSPLSAQNYIPVVGPALGGTHVRAWELWVVLRTDGPVKRYIAYGHYVNGETRRIVERSHTYSTQTGKNVQGDHL
jgi:outer membrane protein assembly factor BamE (lipoprotein component of BamABCDE complex)